jgi:hypothetical protein
MPAIYIIRKIHCKSDVGHPAQPWRRQVISQSNNFLEMRRILLFLQLFQLSRAEVETRARLSHSALSLSISLSLSFSLSLSTAGSSCMYTCKCRQPIDLMQTAIDRDVNNSIGWHTCLGLVKKNVSGTKSISVVLDCHCLCQIGIPFNSFHCTKAACYCWNNVCFFKRLFYTKNNE